MSRQEQIKQAEEKIDNASPVQLIQYSLQIQDKLKQLRDKIQLAYYDYVEWAKMAPDEYKTANLLNLNGDDFYNMMKSEYTGESANDYWQTVLAKKC